jgi:hypothetical protein
MPTAISYVITFNILLIDPIKEDIIIDKNNILIDMSDLSNINLNERNKTITLDWQSDW